METERLSNDLATKVAGILEAGHLDQLFGYFIRNDGGQEELVVRLEQAHRTIDTAQRALDHLFAEPTPVVVETPAPVATPPYGRRARKATI